MNGEYGNLFEIRQIWPGSAAHILKGGFEARINRDVYVCSE